MASALVKSAPMEIRVCCCLGFSDPLAGMEENPKRSVGVVGRLSRVPRAPLCQASVQIAAVKSSERPGKQRRRKHRRSG